jgi:hypothetical protein
MGAKKTDMKMLLQELVEERAPFVCTCGTCVMTVGSPQKKGAERLSAFPEWLCLCSAEFVV